MTRKKLFIWLLLLMIIFVGTNLRTIHFKEKGLFFWDEGLFLMGSKFINWRLPEILDNVHRFGWQLTSLHSDTKNFKGYPVFLQKPGHVFLLAIAEKLLGSHDYTGQLTSALFGVMSLLMVYLIGKYLGGSKVGLIAALFLALSPMHLHYSRTGLHEITSSFFVLIAVWLHFLSLKRREKKGYDEILFFFSGLALGYAVICSYRWIIFILYMLFVDLIIFSVRRKGFFTITWRFLLFGSGFLVPISYAEFLYFISFYPDYTKFQPVSYFVVLLYKFTTETHFDMSSPFHYITLLYQLNGIIFLFFVAIGLYIVYRKRIWTHYYIAGFFVFPLLLYSFNTTRVARAISILSPWMAILVAIAIIQMMNFLKEKFRYHHAILIILLVLPILQLLKQDYVIINLKSGYKEAFNYISTESNGKHLSTMAPIGAFYFGRKAVPLHPPESIEALKQYCQYGNFRFLLVDWQKYVWYYPSIAKIEKDFKPVKIIKNQYVDFISVLNENYIPGYLEELKAKDKTLSQIKIYDLNKCFHIPLPIETLYVKSKIKQKPQS